MKKKLLIGFTLLFVIITSVYIFIPGKIKYSEQIIVHANNSALKRNLGDKNKWRNWWPSQPVEKIAGQEKFILNGLNFELTDIQTLSLPILVSEKKLSSAGELTFLSTSVDFTILRFEGIVTASNSPFDRIRSYFYAKKIKKELNTILSSINQYYSSSKSLYGYDIKKEHVVDSLLLFKSEEVKGKPNTNKIYSIIDELRSYIKKNSAIETGYPMLNIFKIDSGLFRIKVAIPVNKILPAYGNISVKEMLGGGNILITEVKGGDSEIEKAFYQVQSYISDYKRVAPAIPFQSLITNRRGEADSTKWVTKIYYPVM